MKAIGIDLYNQNFTGGVSMSLRATRGDNEHIPCVLILNSSGGVSQELSIQAITKDKDFGKVSKENT